MEDGNHPDDEAGLQVAHLGQARKEGQIAIGDDVLIQLVKPLNGDEPYDFGVTVHAAHEVAGHPKRAEVLHWPHRGRNDVAYDPNGQLSGEIRQRRRAASPRRHESRPARMELWCVHVGEPEMRRLDYISSRGARQTGELCLS